MSLKNLRRNKFTQAELAEKLGISQQAISNWESGLSRPRCPMISRLATLLEVSPLDILMCFDKESDNDSKCG